MDYVRSITDPIVSAVPNLLKAILLLVVALVVANIVKSLVIKGSKKLGLDKYTEKWGLGDYDDSSLDFIGKIIYLIVFLLFLPGIFSLLGLSAITTPITGMLNQIFAFLPNFIAAVIIVIIGYFVAKLIRQIVTVLLRKTQIDQLQKRAGIEVKSENTTLSSLLGTAVFVFIWIITIFASLQVLGIRAISEPVLSMMNKIFDIIPGLFVAIVLLVLGVFIGKTAGTLLTNVLSGTGVDKALTSITSDQDSSLKKLVPSQFFGQVIRFIIILLFVVEALNVIGLKVLEDFGSMIINYLPSIISAVIILVGGVILANWVSSLIVKNTSGTKLTAMLTKTIIIVVAIFMTLSQLGFAMYIVHIAFAVILGALAIAFAIAFGIGGRDFASKTLAKWNDKNNKTDKE